MAEIEPASDEEVNQWECLAQDILRYGPADRGLHINWMKFAAILARIAAEKARADKAEADNASLTKLLSGYHQICSEAGIAPSSSVIYAAAEAREAMSPTWFAEADNWDYTADDISHITDGLSWNDSVRVHCFAALPDKWVACIPIDTDGDGEADDSEIRWFDTEKECRRATQGGENG